MSEEHQIPEFDDYLAKLEETCTMVEGIKSIVDNIDEKLMRLLLKKIILYITKNKMKKYQYTANVMGNKIICIGIPDLTKAINDTVGFPIVTKDSLYNYFIRPHVVKSKKLDALQLERHLLTFTNLS